MRKVLFAFTRRDIVITSSDPLSPNGSSDSIGTNHRLYNIILCNIISYNSIADLFKFFTRRQFQYQFFFCRRLQQSLRQK